MLLDLKILTDSISGDVPLHWNWSRESKESSISELSWCKSIFISETLNHLSFTENEAIVPDPTVDCKSIVPPRLSASLFWNC